MSWVLGFYASSTTYGVSEKSCCLCELSILGRHLCVYLLCTSILGRLNISSQVVVCTRFFHLNQFLVHLPYHQSPDVFICIDERLCKSIKNNT